MMHKFKTVFQINNLVLLGAFILAMTLAVDTFGAINKNYQLAQDSDALRAQNKLQELRNENLKLNNEYLKSNDYLELAVRDQLGLGAPGDKELIFTNLPPAKKSKHATRTHQANDTPKWQQNFSDWMDFLLRQKNPDINLGD